MNYKKIIIAAVILILATSSFIYFFLYKRSVSTIIKSDKSWKYWPKEEKGWYELDHNDSHWNKADIAKVLDVFRRWERDLNAVPIWGREVDKIVYTRKVFHLKKKPGRQISAFLQVDDDYELYVNGNLVAKNEDKVLTLPGEGYDVTKHLRSGKNVIAIKSIDYGWDKHIFFSLQAGVDPSAKPLPAKPASPKKNIFDWLPRLGPKWLAKLKINKTVIAVVTGCIFVLFWTLSYSSTRISSEGGIGNLIKRVGSAARWFIEQL